MLKVRIFLRKYHKLISYLLNVIALVLAVILLYEEIVIERGNPLVLLILTGLLVVVILEYYLSRRRNLVAHFILESSEHVALYAVDLDDCYMAFNKFDIELVEKFYDFTPKIGDNVFENLNEEEASRLSNNIERAKKGETFTFTDEVKLDGKTYYWENLVWSYFRRPRKNHQFICEINF
ncbi:GGDEF domain containing membrane protein [Streptococcus equinus]|nr:GGDEF domain containing membrane protein [Streptococcus equinus]VTS82098.1 GGDEF domain containing membrane protein [Streptococcus equinus]